MNVETRIEPRDPLKTKEPTNRGTNQPTMGQSEPTTRMDRRMDGWIDGRWTRKTFPLGSSSVALTTVISLEFVLLPWVWTSHKLALAYVTNQMSTQLGIINHDGVIASFPMDGWTCSGPNHVHWLITTTDRWGWV